MKSGKSRTKIVVIAMLCLFAAVLCVSIFMVASQILQRRHSAETLDELRDRLARPSETVSPEREETAPESDPGVNPNPNLEPDPDPSGDPDADTDRDSLLLERYAALKEENPDFFGWLAISNTVIDYPVMHTPSDPEYYLRRAFDGSYATGGVPFLDGVCYEGCGNFIIYGHNMRNGTMFADLLKYADQSFWQAHPVIRFDTQVEIAEYEVLAAFYGRIYYVDETDVFRYYRYTDVSDPDVFEEYIAQVRAAALYNTDVDAQPGDQLITLSTCSKHTENGRFVVVARKIIC